MKRRAVGVYVDECNWCGHIGITHCHHFPIPKKMGGKDIIHICPNCHAMFHGGFLIRLPRLFDAENELNKYILKREWRILNKCFPFADTRSFFINDALPVFYLLNGWGDRQPGFCRISA